VEQKIRVIVADDDSELQEGLVEYLHQAGFDAYGVGSGLECYRALAGIPFNVAVIDVGLPDQSGFTIAEYLREHTTMGVIIMTARDGMEDRLQGYDSGADLYLTKPVDCRELAAAIRNLAVRLAEHALSPDREPVADAWTVAWRTWHLVTPAGLPIPLTAREMKFVSCLAEAPGQTVNRDRLLVELGYRDDEYANRAMDSLVRRLRRKIEEVSGLSSPIMTVRSVGYCFPAAVVTR